MEPEETPSVVISAPALQALLVGLQGRTPPADLDDAIEEAESALARFTAVVPE